MKTKMKAWSVAGNKIREKIRPGMPPEMVAAIEEEANHRDLVDVYGEGFQVDAHGNPIEQGRYSLPWLLAHTEDECENHFAAIEKFVGPAAARAEREKVARLRGKK
jgi:hypothetical protein